MKLPVAQKMITLTTEFDDFDGRMRATENSSEPVLQVQMDLEKAQETEVDVEITVIANSSPLKSRLLMYEQNGFWPDLYPYLGITNLAWYYKEWQPP
jgi:hypothetical protein